MSEKRFEARGPHNSGACSIFDNKHDSTRTYFTANYPGGPQAAAEAEAARLNAWWQEEQAKNKWQLSILEKNLIGDSSGQIRIYCYATSPGCDHALAARVCRLLNEDEARTK